jgi:hypothetical protein
MEAGKGMANDPPLRATVNSNIGDRAFVLNHTLWRKSHKASEIVPYSVPNTHAISLVRTREKGERGTVLEEK